MADDGAPRDSHSRLQINLLPGAERGPQGFVQRKLSGLSVDDESALHRVVGGDEQAWTVFGWKWERVGRELMSASESVSVLRDALSPDDFAHLKSAAAKQILKVDEALAGVSVELETAAPHLIETVRTRQRAIQAALGQAVFEGEQPPDAMFVTGEYER